MHPIGRLFILMVLGFFIHTQTVSASEFVERFFKPSRMVSLETAKKELKKIYLEGGHMQTLHCGCFFDKLQQVYPQSCRLVDGPTRADGGRQTLDWVHGMPPAMFAGGMTCWQEDACRSIDGDPFKGYDCCTVQSPRFKSMEADMHNLIPVVDAAGSPAVPPSKAHRLYGGMGEYRFCRDQDTPPAEPRPGTRGDLARAYFYMSFQYEVPIPDDLEDKLRMWHLKDPPDGWEEEKNTLVEMVQGNRNPFIDKPELAERVRNF